MKLKSRFWSDLTWRDFADLPSTLSVEEVVAVLPVAAVEQHGPHLPLSVDQTLIDGIIQASLPLMADDLAVLILPTQAVGKSVEHEQFPGTLSLNTSTIVQLWMDIGASVARAGLKKLLLFNSHGGNVAVMDIVARDLRAIHGLIVYSCSWFNLPMPQAVEELFPPEEHRFGIHAGDIETSMMLALRSDSVDMSHARNFRSTSQDRAEHYSVLGNGRSAKLGWQMQDYNEHGAAGNAQIADPYKGQLLVDTAARGLVTLLDEFSRLPVSTVKCAPSLSAASK